MTKVDFKKKYKDLYLPKGEPMLITVPSINFIMIDGKGNPNNEDGEYKKAVELLYALSYTIKMSTKNGFFPVGYYDYVVPPLEGLWWLIQSNSFTSNNNISSDFTQKDNYCWTSMIRQPEFVTNDLFIWAQSEVIKKKPDLDVTKARLQTLSEGLSVQMMHHGPYDKEPESIKIMDDYITHHELITDIGNTSEDGSIRRHHEIYLGDPRKIAPERLRTVLRIPVKRNIDLSVISQI